LQNTGKFNLSPVPLVVQCIFMGVNMSFV